MAAIANGIDFLFCSGLSGKPALVSKNVGTRSLMVACYILTAIFLVCMQDFSRVPGLPDFSFVYFLGSTLQFMGYFCLCVKVKSSRSVAGISSQSVVMTGFSLSLRVFATTIYEGYLPADKTGDFMLQVVDACTFGLTAYMLYSIHKTHVHTYQEEHDELKTKWIFLSCFVMAIFVHADLNHCEIYDTMWAFSLNVEIFQTLPQLYMMSKVGGLVDTMTAHYVVLTFLAAACRFAFWVWAVPGCQELALPDQYNWNIQTGGYYILGAYLLEMMVQLDFMYFYVKSWSKGDSTVYLPSVSEI